MLQLMKSAYSDRKTGVTFAEYARGTLAFRHSEANQFSSSTVPATIRMQPMNIASGQRLRGVA
jgi:hypothetical protein